MKRRTRKPKTENEESADNSYLQEEMEEEEEDDHIKITEQEDSEFMEFPKEDDGTVLLSTIQAQFPHAIGVKYKGSSGAWRAIRAVDNVLESPKGGWGDRVYCMTISETKKRKLSDSPASGERGSKVGRANPLLSDMAVIGLPFKTTIEELKEYFETNYGELAYSEIKYDRETGKSRGFGFIRFKDEETAKQALKGEHYMMGRKVEVRQKKDKPMKMFIGRLPHGTTKEDLEAHFSEYGELTDTYIPTPFRNFAFITFASSEEAKICMRDSHVLDGARLNVMERNQYKDKPTGNDDQRSFSNTSNTSYGGYNTNQNPRDAQKSNYQQSNYQQSNYQQSNYQQSNNTPQNGNKAQPNMDSDLKTMLFQFLASQN